MSFNPGDVVTVDFPGVTGIKRSIKKLNNKLTLLSSGRSEC
ncbi:hypothetical protein [Floridanema evergladense]|uniref:Uncharacterized protein n=1 Tax=Floridaenema evergladense BLCC-F167 TaxID=3153639 RepID=A0ABV4WJR2_9CYAN